MTSSISSASGRSPITLAAGFRGDFIGGYSDVQRGSSQEASVQAGEEGVEPVRAGPAALGGPLAEREIASATTGATAQTTGEIQPAVEPVVGSEATLWAPFGER